VELPEGDGWGAVTYRRTKTAEQRRILLHPEAVAALRAVMRQKPTRFERDTLATWEQTPIFRRHRSARPWDTSSFRKAWGHARKAAAIEHPEVGGMWLRDLRKVAKTRMIDAGASELVVNRILGHRDGVVGHYYTLTDEAMQEALGALSLESRTPNRTPATVDSAVS